MRNSYQTEKPLGRLILTDNVGLAGEYGILELVGNHAEFVIGGPVNSDGVVGSRAELFSNCGRVGSCEHQECSSVEKHSTLGYISEMSDSQSRPFSMGPSGLLSQRWRPQLKQHLVGLLSV